jgi:hypothetical protein
MTATPTMNPPDPITLDFAARLPWSYDDVHRWLGILAALGATPAQAGELFEGIADAGVDPEDVIAYAVRIALA